MTTSITRIAVTFAVVPALLLSASGCDRNDKIEGAVKDVFGGALSDVSVSIEKSAFKAISSADGAYALDFAPGQFTVVFSKPGYTTHRMDLNISQKVRFPAEEMRLYPLPTEPGVYLVDYSSKRLTEFLKNVAVSGKESPAGLMETLVVFELYPLSGTTRSNIPMFAAGKLEFIDKTSSDNPNVLSKVRDEDFIMYRYIRTPPNNRVLYRSLPKESTENIGSEKLLVRTYTLSPGVYAFAPHFTAMNGNKVPVKDAQARAFEVK